MTETRGPGLDQGEARRRAKKLGGIAVSARPSAKGDGVWHTGGWPSEKDVWIVISPATEHTKAFVLDDGGRDDPEEKE